MNLYNKNSFLITVLVAILCSSFFHSCKKSEQVLYFQGEFIDSSYQLHSSYFPIIQKNDMLEVMLTTANELTTEYETELKATKKQAQQEIVASQKIQKQSFEIELNLSQKYIDTLLEKILGNFAKTKETIFEKLESDKVVDSLCDQMLGKLFAKS